MTRVPCGSDEKLSDGLNKKGPWTPDEDHKLLVYIQKHGHGSWRSLPLNAGLQRCGKSCRLRWTNYLRPDIKRGRFSHDEDQLIIHLHAMLGNRWSAIASYLPRRTDNEIKNYWNTHLKKRLLQMGIDPVTHKLSTESTEEVPEEEQLIIPDLQLRSPVDVYSNLTHMSQWDSFRAEAEARLSSRSRHGQSTSICSSDYFQQHEVTNHGGLESSTAFMSMWKSQVADTLRLSFGEVELDKSTVLTNNHHPVDFQTTFLQQHWESSTSQNDVQSTLSICGSPIDILADLSSGTTVSPQFYRTQGSHQAIFPTPEQITTEKLLFSLDSADSQSLSAAGSMSTFSFAATICGDSSESQLSPTSTLHEHDSSSYTNSSPCNSSNFDVLAHPFQDSSSEQSKVQSQLVFPQLRFWSQQQQVAMTTDARFSFGGAIPMLNPVVGVPNNIPIPQFDSLM